MPPLALANNNWLGPAPLELSTLTQAELLFIARGFSHVVLRQLRTAGDPRSRQQGLVGGIVAFPQDGGPLLDLLPRRAGELAEYFSVVFSSDDSDKVRSHRALLVRRTRVAAALRWLEDQLFQLCVDVCGCRLLAVRTRERRRRAGQPQRLAQCCVHRRGGLCALSCSPRVGGLVAGDDQHVHVP